MIMEIIIGAIAVAFVVLVVFLSRTLAALFKTLKRVDRVLADAHKMLESVSEESAHLLHNSNRLVLDIKKKSEGLDIFFHPLYEMKKEAHSPVDKNGYEKASRIIDYVADGVRLFSKIREDVKKHGK